MAETEVAGADYVEVSPEMTLALDGANAPLPPDAMAIAFSLDGEPSVVVNAEPGGEAQIVLWIERAAFIRVGGGAGRDTHAYHLPTELRTIALAIRDSALAGETLKVYRLGKSIELLCETIRMLDAGALTPMGANGALSMDDTRRVIAARRLIDERWGQKLTLDGIARACGLNRAKLTRGFRDLFGCTVAEALAERRLHQARHMLLTTDLPVSSIGYENGYLNNASFARAFGRRFGVSPSDLRACAAA